MKIDLILDPDLSPQEVSELGLLAERYGFRAVWTSNYPSSRDPFISLCPLALASSTIRLGPLVVTPYEMHPYKIAKALATLNELCGGRANILTGGPTGVNATMGAGFSRRRHDDRASALESRAHRREPRVLRANAEGLPSKLSRRVTCQGREERLVQRGAPPPRAPGHARYLVSGNFPG